MVRSRAAALGKHRAKPVLVMSPLNHPRLRGGSTERMSSHFTQAPILRNSVSARSHRSTQVRDGVGRDRELALVGQARGRLVRDRCANGSARPRSMPGGGQAHERGIAKIRPLLRAEVKSPPRERDLEGGVGFLSAELDWLWLTS